MRDRLLLGIGDHMIPVPGCIWRTLVRAAARKTAAGLEFMSEDHHRVRDFVVTELPRTATR
jgi:Tfp pilus assembly protein PilZ